MLAPVSVGLKFGFLIILYLFLLFVAWSATRDLRRGRGGVVQSDRRPPSDATGMYGAAAGMGELDVFEPRLDAAGNFAGLTNETWFYDPEAFVQPLHNTMHFNRVAKMDDPNRRYTYIECLSNLRNTNGRPTQLTAADPRYIDYYGRPWAQNWDKFFEAGWDKPNEELPADVLDLLDKLDKRK